ncbi:MAG: hypothetical protein GJ676_09590 [Rhodobacteraceae bacterium]|nr:hypothetical protein [Paracoccaceae bacterium]
MIDTLAVLLGLLAVGFLFALPAFVAASSGRSWLFWGIASVLVTPFLALFALALLGAPPELAGRDIPPDAGQA